MAEKRGPVVLEERGDIRLVAWELEDGSFALGLGKRRIAVAGRMSEWTLEEPLVCASVRSTVALRDLLNEWHPPAEKREEKRPVQRCRSCKARIIWCKLLPSGKPHPLDLAPVISGGTIEPVRERSSDRTLVARVVPEVERGSRVLYRSHFATCPDAKAWREHTE